MTIEAASTADPAVRAVPGLATKATGAEPLWTALASRPSLAKLVRHQLAAWPDHEKYLTRRFKDDAPEFLDRTEEVASLALQLIGDDVETYCADYKWMCENHNAEQLYFLTNGTYRYSTFADAYANVYSDHVYMTRYLHELLLSQIFWRNHALALDHYRTRFLPGAPRHFAHLEVGPGHGLFLYFAACEAQAGSITGWELTDGSIAATRRCLDRFGIADRVSLVQQDVLRAPPQAEAFDTILISEVLEHLERPHDAMETLRVSLKPSGRLLINVPINSPAPDHIYLWSSPDEVAEFARGCGFSIVDSAAYPLTGYTLEKALRHRYSVSCVLTLSRAR